MRHSNDVISLESWIKDVNDSGTVSYYKAQGTSCSTYSCLKEDDFLLIIMHPGQLEVLQKYSSDCICIDGTHGLNAYNFELYWFWIICGKDLHVVLYFRIDFYVGYGTILLDSLDTTYVTCTIKACTSIQLICIIVLLLISS